MLDLRPSFFWEDLLRTTDRVSYSQPEVDLLLKILKRGRRKGRDCHFGITTEDFDGDTIRHLAARGLVLVSSPVQLGQTFALVKCKTGWSIFGQRKVLYRSFLGATFLDDWVIGSTFPSWILAAGSIGDVYRRNGFR